MRTRFEASIEKRSAVKKAELSGEIVDSKDVRLKLMERVHNKEITLKEAQAELKRIQYTGKTRAQVYNEN